jgi:hypothetical protein
MEETTQRLFFWRVQSETAVFSTHLQFLSVSTNPLLLQAHKTNYLLQTQGFKRSSSADLNEERHLTSRNRVAAYGSTVTYHTMVMPLRTSFTHIHSARSQNHDENTQKEETQQTTGSSMCFEDVMTVKSLCPPPTVV